MTAPPSTGGHTRAARSGQQSLSGGGARGVGVGGARENPGRDGETEMWWAVELWENKLQKHEAPYKSFVATIISLRLKIGLFCFLKWTSYHRFTVPPYLPPCTRSGQLAALGGRQTERPRVFAEFRLKLIQWRPRQDEWLGPPQTAGSHSSRGSGNIATIHASYISIRTNMPNPTFISAKPSNPLVNSSLSLSDWTLDCGGAV